MSEKQESPPLPKPLDTLGTADPLAERSLSGHHATGTLARTQPAPRPEPSFTALLARDHFAPLFQAVIDMELHQEYGLRVFHFDRASELLRLAAEHGFDLLALYLGNVRWDAGSGNGIVGPPKSVLRSLHSVWGSPVFVTQGMKLAGDFEGTGVTFVEAPFRLDSFKQVVRASLVIKRSRSPGPAR